MLSQIKKSALIAFPLIITQVVQMGISVTDTIMIGWLGPTELAALTLASTLLFIMYIWIYGFPNAGVALISQARGRKDFTYARRVFRMGVWLVSTASLFSVAALTQTDQILRFLGQEDELISFAVEYMVIAKWTVLPFMIFTMFRSFLMSIDRAYIIFWVPVIGLVFNAVLNYMLIFGKFGAPRLEIQGAAIASVSSSVLMLLLILTYTQFAKSTRDFNLFKRIYKLDANTLLHVFKLGFPIGLTTLVEVSSFSAATVLMGWVGKIELAAHGILMQIFALAFMISLGISQAATIRVGILLGESNIIELRKVAMSIYILGLGVSILIILVLIVSGNFFVTLFLDQGIPKSNEVIEYASVLIFFGIAFHFFDCGQILSIGLLRGLSDTRIPFYLSLFSFWGIGISVAYFLSIYTHFSGFGVWVGLGLGMASCFTGLSYRFEILNQKLLTKNIIS